MKILQKLHNGHEINIHLSDCVQGMKDFVEDASVDVIVTSPPYNINTQYSQYKDNKSEAEYMEWSISWLSEALRCLKDDGSLFLNIGGTASDPLFPLRVAQNAEKLFDVQNLIHWVKAITIDADGLSTKTRKKVPDGFSAGHFKPINSDRYLNVCQEYIFHMVKKGQKVKVDRLAVGTSYVDSSNKSRWETGKSGKRCRGNIWFLPYRTIMSKDDRPHPATYPVQLPLNCIKLHGQPNALAMDPFLGIGSSAIAAMEFGCDFIGFEMDQAYFDEASERISHIAS